MAELFEFASFGVPAPIPCLMVEGVKVMGS